MKTRITTICLYLLLVLSASAEPRYRKSSVSHWLGWSITGVEANAFTKSRLPIEMLVGGGGQFHLQYELHKGGFFCNLGFGADYMLTQLAIPSYSNEFKSVDYTGEKVLYRYCYADYKEQQRQVRLVVPIQFGYQFEKGLYVGVGAAFRVQPLINTYSTHTRMLTEGEYDRFIQPIRNAPDYGYWTEDEYTGSGKVKSATNEMALEVEIGARIPNPAKWFNLRIGAFIGYDFPLGSFKSRKETPLVDYSAIDVNPSTQSIANLQENIRFNSILDANIVSASAQRLRVGLRLTMLFDVTTHRKHCMCNN